MPLNAINYTNTIIYKIVCRNLDVVDLYVGHTTSFKDRKKSHKSTCNTEKNKNYNVKLYQTIRDNGGWENWDMIEIEKYSCNDLQEARARERYWYEILSPKLNTVLPLTTKEDIAKQNHESYLRRLDKNPDANKEHYQKYKESQKNMKKIYQKNHKTEKKEYDKKRCLEKKDELKQKKKEYYEKNKEIINQKRREKYLKSLVLREEMSETSSD
jgi:hypothetical protein